MNKIFVPAAILGLVLGLASRPARADGKTDEKEVKTQGSAASGVNFLKDQKPSSKFFEYRDVPRGGFLRSFDLSVEKGDSFFTIRGKNIRQADSRYDISAGSYGILRADFTWDEIPHRFSFSGKTLYNEPQPGVYTLPDGLRTLLQNTVGDGSANTTASMPAARALLKTFLTGAHGIDLGLDRHKGTFKLSYAPAVAWSFNFDASRETREGTRPQGGALGSSNTIELPEPINNTTTELRASTEYAGKWGTVQAGYSASLFDNGIPTLTWENPYRITDQYGSASAGNGPAVARMPLDPSNTAQKLYLSGAFKILPSTRLSGSVSYGVFSQNEKLLPYTSNSALADPALGFAGALNPPRATAEAKANVASMDFTLATRIQKNVHLTAGYRYYDFANKTEPLAMPDGSALVDQTWSTTANPIDPYSYTRSKMFGEVIFDLWKNTAVKAGYTVASIERKGGFEEELASLAGPGNRNKTDEKTFKFSLDSNPLDWFLLRASYLNAGRTWSLDGKVDIYAAGYGFRRYFEASRNRKGLNVLVGLDPIKNLDIQLSYMLGKDSYPQSQYGLRSSDFTMAGVDLSWAIGSDTSLYGYYSREVSRGTQAERRPTSTDPRDDWWVGTQDAVQSFGAGFNSALKKDVLSLDLSASYSKARGSADLAAGPGGAAAPISILAYTHPLDATEMLSLRAELSWKFSRSLSVGFGYWYELYKLDDIVRTGVQVDMIVPSSIAGGASGSSTIFLGALEPGYNYHVGFLEVIWTW